MGILIGLSRLAADSEITAMRASGMGMWSFLRMLSIFVMVAWIAALANGLYVAPRAQAALGHLEDRLKGSQVSFEIQPRVFYEGFPKIVLYVQDVKSAQGAAIWKGVFMADLSDAANPRITLAKEGIVVSEGPDRLHLHLIDGSEHETDPKDADHYQISTFEQTDIPIELPSTENKADESLPAGEMDTRALLDKARRSILFPRAGISSNSTAALPCLPPVWCSLWSASRLDSRPRRAASPAASSSPSCWSLPITSFH